MAVTYEQARELVRQKYEPGWTHGTFCLDDRTITEHDDYFSFSIGAREWLVDGDESYALAGAVPIVYKEDGRVAALPSPMVATDPRTRVRPNPDPTLQV